MRNVATREDLADEVAWVRFSELSWTHDSQGFFYSRYPEPPKHKVLEAALSGQAVYYHRLGTPQSDDQLIYQRTRPSRRGSSTRRSATTAAMCFSRRIAAPTTTTSCTSSISNAPHRRGLRHRSGRSSKRSTRSSRRSATTDRASTSAAIRDAPNRCVIAIDLEDPDPRSWKVVVPEQAEPIEHARVVGGRIIVHQLVDVQSRLRVMGLDGQSSSEIALPARWLDCRDPRPHAICTNCGSCSAHH